MGSYSPDLGGMGAPSGFAPADFGDADEMRPLGAVFDIGGHGSSTPYTTAMNSMIHKHMDEIKGKTATSLSLPTSWRKRLRDFISQKNTDLLDFLSISVASHPTLGKGEVLMRRFGNPQVTPSHPSVREFVLDVSGDDVVKQISDAVEAVHGEGGLKDYANKTRLIYEQYQAAGDEVLRQNTSLKAKLEKLDRIQGKLSALFEIDPNETYQPLMESTEAYLKKVFEESKIEEDYTALIAAYRRFAALRDVVLMSRALVAQETEPICTICLQETVGFALTPCGHTFCSTCMRRQSGSCYICRTPIRDRVRLYFG